MPLDIQLAPYVKSVIENLDLYSFNMPGKEKEAKSYADTFAYSAGLGAYKNRPGLGYRSDKSSVAKELVDKLIGLLERERDALRISGEQTDLISKIIQNYEKLIDNLKEANQLPLNSKNIKEIHRIFSSALENNLQNKVSIISPLLIADKWESFKLFSNTLFNINLEQGKNHLQEMIRLLRPQIEELLPEHKFDWLGNITENQRKRVTPVTNMIQELQRLEIDTNELRSLLWALKSNPGEDSAKINFFKSVSNVFANALDTITKESDRRIMFEIWNNFRVSVNRDCGVIIEQKLGNEDAKNMRIDINPAKDINITPKEPDALLDYIEELLTSLDDKYNDIYSKANNISEYYEPLWDPYDDDDEYDIIPDSALAINTLKNTILSALEQLQEDKIPKGQSTMPISDHIRGTRYKQDISSRIVFLNTLNEAFDKALNDKSLTTHRNFIVRLWEGLKSVLNQIGIVIEPKKTQTEKFISGYKTIIKNQLEMHQSETSEQNNNTTEDFREAFKDIRNGSQDKPADEDQLTPPAV